MIVVARVTAYHGPQDPDPCWNLANTTMRFALADLFPRAASL